MMTYMKDIGSDSDLYKTKVKHQLNFVEKDFKPIACKIEIAGTHILTSHAKLISILQKLVPNNPKPALCITKTTRIPMQVFSLVSSRSRPD